MTSVEAEVLEALVDLERAVETRRTSLEKPPLAPLLARLDELTERLPADTDPELAHFMKRKSYEKARSWLEGRGAARGTCGEK